VEKFLVTKQSNVTFIPNNCVIFTLLPRGLVLGGLKSEVQHLSLSIPVDPGVVVPGYYMLFALDAKGVPSVSGTLRIH